MTRDNKQRLGKTLERGRFVVTYREILNTRRVRRVGAGARRGAVSLVRYLLILGISFVILYPLLVKITVSLMTEKDLMDLTVKWIPRTLTLENYRVAIRALKIEDSLVNSLFYTVGITLIQLLSCTLAAYGFARYRYPGSSLILAILIFSLAVPPYTYSNAVYMEFRFFDPFGLITLLKGSEGIVNTMWPFIIKAALCQGLRNGLYIFLMVQFFRNLPAELEEAANVDGAGMVKVFFRIICPNAVPIIVTVGVLSIVWQWNDSYFTAQLGPRMDFLATNVLNIQDLLRESTGVTDFMQQDTARVSAAKNAAAMVMSFPIILFFAVIQKFFAENLARSGIVG